MRENLSVVRRRLSAAACLCVVLLVLSACDEASGSSFGGVKGVVGHPAIAEVDIDIYNALEFVSLDSQSGLIASGRSDEGGRFAIELEDKHLGRPLILVARPGPDAMYRDFGAPGNPDIPFNAARSPWVGVHNEWLGGEAPMAINPLTTMAFHSLMRLPKAEVGPGVLRFDRDIINGVHAAIGAGFGIKSNLGTASPAPPVGSPFEEISAFGRENNNRSAAYTYVCLQLAKAANDFALTAGGSALDFYEALFRDAMDGVLDGMVFGEPEPYLNEIPAVIGRDADGVSEIVRYIGSFALTPQEEGWAGHIRNGNFDPAPATILALQDEATGALRPTRIDSFDVRNFPFSGNVELTVRGQGFRRTDRFIFRSHSDPSAEFFVDRESVGVDGQFLYHSDTELRLRIPDFAQTTKAVPSNLQVPAGQEFRRLRFVLRNQPEIIPDPFRDVSHLLTDNARMTNRSELLLVNVEAGRVDAVGDLRAAPFANVIHDDATDPDALDPAIDDVFELRVRVVNPGPDAVHDVALDLGLSIFTQLGADVIADVFGGSEPGRALIFADPPPQADLNPGEVARLDYRFLFLDSAFIAEILEGVPVLVTPVMAGVSQGPGNTVMTTADVVGFNRTVEIGPAANDPTPEIDAPVAPQLPASVTAGDEFEIRLPLTAVPRAGALMRNLRVERLDVMINFDGEDTLLTLTDAFFEMAGNSGLYFVSLTLESTGGTAMPAELSQPFDTDALILTVRTDPARTGLLSAEFSVQAIDPATGARSEGASPGASVTVAP